MKFYAALSVSVGLHIVLGVVGGICLNETAAPDQLVQLDLSSVELSFAEKEQESAPVAPPAVETPPPPPPEKKEEEKVEEKKEEKEEEKKEEKVVEEKKEEEKPIEEPKPTPPPPAPAPQPATPPPVAPRQAAIDAPPRPRKTIKPDYPRGARARGEQGEVELEIEVGANGRVTSAKVVHSSGYPELDGAALAAARAAKFVPAKSGRKSVASTARLKLHFQLK